MTQTKFKKLHKIGIQRGQIMLCPSTCLFHHLLPNSPLPYPPLLYPQIPLSPATFLLLLYSPAHHSFLPTRISMPLLPISAWCRERPANESVSLQGYIYSLAVTLNTSILKCASLMTAKLSPAVLSFLLYALRTITPLHSWLPAVRTCILSWNLRCCSCPKNFFHCYDQEE